MSLLHVKEMFAGVPASLRRSDVRSCIIMSHMLSVPQLSIGKHFHCFRSLTRSENTGKRSPCFTLLIYTLGHTSEGDGPAGSPPSLPGGDAGADTGRSGGAVLTVCPLTAPHPAPRSASLSGRSSNDLLGPLGQLYLLRQCQV